MINLDFDLENNSFRLNVTNASIVCFGKYQYFFSIFGGSREIIDFWDLVVDQISAIIVLDLTR